MQRSESPTARQLQRYEKQGATINLYTGAEWNWRKNLETAIRFFRVDNGVKARIESTRRFSAALQSSWGRQ